jgi:predicted Rossmann fold nucleotide-binding protein DprA/Smf involved in DNA uptake
MGIVEALNLFVIPQHIEMQAVLPANDEERALLKLISHEACHLDELIRESGLATTTVSWTLTTMELTGSYMMG